MYVCTVSALRKSLQFRTTYWFLIKSLPWNDHRIDSLALLLSSQRRGASSVASYHHQLPPPAFFYLTRLLSFHHVVAFASAGVDESSVAAGRRRGRRWRPVPDVHVDDALRRLVQGLFGRLLQGSTSRSSGRKTDHHRCHSGRWPKVSHAIIL